MMTCLATGQGGVQRLSRRPSRQQQRCLLLREFSQDETQDESCQSQKLGRHQADIR